METNNNLQPQGPVSTVPEKNKSDKTTSFISLITGLLGIVLLVIAPVMVIFPPSVMGILSVLAIVFGIFGLKGNRKVATIGLVLGVIGLVVLFIFMSLAEARRKVVEEDFINQPVSETLLEEVDTSILSVEPFSSVEGKFQINFPDKWSLKQQENSQGVFVELSADQSNEVIINAISVPKVMRVSELADSIVFGIKSSGYKLVDEKRDKIELGGEEGILLKVTVEDLEDLGKIYLQTHLLVVSKNGQTYQFTGTAPESRPETQEIFEASFSTFKALR